MASSSRSRRRAAASDDNTDDTVSHLQRLYRACHAVIRRIPSGHVATYGQVAELAGIPGGARVAAAALKTSQPSDGLPWQRVIGKAGKLRGRIAIHDPVGAAIQRELLSQEGVELGETGLVALDRFGWLPTESAPKKRAASKKKTTAGSSRGASPRQRLRSASTRRASSSRR